MSASHPKRAFALEVVQRLRAEGHQALWAGGCVRDALLGVPPKDYDVATDAPPDRVREVFGRKRTVAVGAAFGVITVLGPPEAGPIEVATFRADGSYADGRRPDAVRFTSAEEDARRRDFTVNGLFYDPVADSVLDYVEGRNDLQRRVVRAIGDPDARIGEDRLRMLRAVRFAASLGFAIDPATAEAVRRHAGAITSVSAERAGMEVRRMLTEADPPRALRLLHETLLLPQVLPEVLGDAFATAVARLEGLRAPSATLALAATLLDAGDADSAAARARALRWTGHEVERVRWLVEHRRALDGADSAPWSAVQPILAHAGGADLARLRRSERGDDPAQRICELRLGWPRELLDPQPLLLGADLIAAGKRPGPDFSALLARARAMQLDGEAADRADVLRRLGIATE